MIYIHFSALCFCVIQYSLGVKRDETQKLEEIAQAEERKLELAEQYLEEDAAMFDEFLKENDYNSAEAMRMYVYCKNPKKWDTRKIAVIILKFELCGLNIE